MGKINIEDKFSIDKEEYTINDVIEAGDDNKTMSQLLSNDAFLKKLIESNIIFSAERPTGNFSLWLKDEGEIIDPAEVVELAIAPLDADGDFKLMTSDTEGETILNMTDNPETAKDDDIIITED